MLFLIPFSLKIYYGGPVSPFFICFRSFRYLQEPSIKENNAFKLSSSSPLDIYIYIYKPVESYCFNFLRSLPHVSQEAKTEPLITPFNDLFFLFLHFLLKPTQQITIENQSSEFKNLLNHYEWKKG